MPFSSSTRHRSESPRSEASARRTPSSTEVRVMSGQVLNIANSSSAGSDGVRDDLFQHSGTRVDSATKEDNYRVDSNVGHREICTAAESSPASAERLGSSRAHGRAGMAWTAEETQILRDLLEREGEVYESFGKIRRGEDAIKRKWRKMLADLPEKKKARLQAKSRDKLRTHTSPEVAVASRLGRPNRPGSAFGSSNLRDGGDRPVDAARSDSSLSEVEDGHCNGGGARVHVNSLPSRDLNHLSAACNNCRRKHKRCVHRTALCMEEANDDYYWSPVERETMAFVLRAPARAKGFTREAIPSGMTPERQYDANGATHPRSPRIGKRDWSFRQTSKVGRCPAAVSRTVQNPAMDSKNKRVYIPRPPNLTKNGKRRGRPPKRLSIESVSSKHHASTNFRRTDSDPYSQSETEYNPRKRRAIEDYEYSPNFEKVISGQKCEDEGSVMNDLYSSDPGRQFHGSLTTAAPSLINSEKQSADGDTSVSSDGASVKLSIASLLNPCLPGATTGREGITIKSTNTSIRSFYTKADRSYIDRPIATMSSSASSQSVASAGSSPRKGCLGLQRHLDSFASKRTSVAISQRGMPNMSGPGTMGGGRAPALNRPARSYPLTVSRIRIRRNSLPDQPCPYVRPIHFGTIPVAACSSLRSSLLAG